LAPYIYIYTYSAKCECDGGCTLVIYVDFPLSRFNVHYICIYIFIIIIYCAIILCTYYIYTRAFTAHEGMRGTRSISIRPAGEVLRPTPINRLPNSSSPRPYVLMYSPERDRVRVWAAVAGENRSRFPQAAATL